MWDCHSIVFFDRRNSNNSFFIERLVQSWTFVFFQLFRSRGLEKAGQCWKACPAGSQVSENRQAMRRAWTDDYWDSVDMNGEREKSRRFLGRHALGQTVDTVHSVRPPNPCPTPSLTAAPGVTSKGFSGFWKACDKFTIMTARIRTECVCVCVATPACPIWILSNTSKIVSLQPFRVVREGSATRLV